MLPHKLTSMNHALNVEPLPVALPRGCDVHARHVTTLLGLANAGDKLHQGRVALGQGLIPLNCIQVVVLTKKGKKKERKKE